MTRVTDGFGLAPGVTTEGASAEPDTVGAGFPVILIPTRNCALACPAQTAEGHNSRHSARTVHLDMHALL
jgi:hypothetical protein